jgi:hypothetical protein
MFTRFADEGMDVLDAVLVALLIFLAGFLSFVISYYIFRVHCDRPNAAAVAPEPVDIVIVPQRP